MLVSDNYIVLIGAVPPYIEGTGESTFFPAKLQSAWIINSSSNPVSQIFLREGRKLLKPQLGEKSCDSHKLEGPKSWLLDENIEPRWQKNMK